MAGKVPARQEVMSFRSPPVRAGRLVVGDRRDALWSHYHGHGAWFRSDGLLAASCPAGRVVTSPLPQAQVSDFKRENEALRSGQGASLTVVKQNTDVALQNLRVVMNNAYASIK